jgi:methylated-DNA-protein-cysteine methyltransferase-like protein
MKFKMQSSKVKTTKQNSNFFESVYKVVKSIPPGKVMTYGQVARVIQNAKIKNQNNRSKFKINPRIVGFALHANKDQNTPCHRVVDRYGRLAPNFAFNGWKEQKMRLISEGVKFKDEMHVDLEKYQLDFIL